MFGLDEWIAAQADGAGIVLVLLVALLLGLRHATDPDHLTAVSTLVLSGPEGGRRAALLGLAWGSGHALTLLALGLPVVLAGRLLPDSVQSAAEVAIGGVIMLLAARLLLRWRRGYFHLHPHAHGELRHAHPHVHEHPVADAHPGEHAHDHSHPADLGRTPLAAFGIGLVHGVGGSAGASILLLGAGSDTTAAVAALVVLAAGTALSMAVASMAFGATLAHRVTKPRLESTVPVFGALALAFGAWYALGALGTVPYVF
jgi:ABC-type nickel/cobalt efflux system permease component RcnA